MSAGAIWAVLIMPWLRQFLPPFPVSVIRDWLPTPLLLVAYRQGGIFFTETNGKLQEKLRRLDQKFFEILQRCVLTGKIQAGINNYLELAYLLCYPLVPLGLGVLYMAHKGRYADEFWTVVLPPTYLCYAMVPFFPTFPPRLLAGEEYFKPRATTLRAFNLWVLDLASIQANTFPSAHVAASVAVSLELIRHVPSMGFVFVWVSASIAAGSVAGRYHYLADVLLGAAIAVIAFGLHGGL